MENEGSSTELGVDSNDVTKITPTNYGEFDYKLKVTVYKDESKNKSNCISLNELLKDYFGLKS